MTPSLSSSLTPTPATSVASRTENHNRSGPPPVPLSPPPQQQEQQQQQQANSAQPSTSNGRATTTTRNVSSSLLLSSSSAHTVDNPMPHRLPEGENATPLEVIGTTASDKLVIIMVGLPATGKTHIAKRICRFLSFFHDIPSQIFNVGDYRRQLCGKQLPATFYDPTNVEGNAARLMACDAAITDLLDYMKQDNNVRVAAFDATNSTKQRRKHVRDIIKNSGLGVKCMFIESICDNDDILEENIRTVKLSTPDYRDMKADDAIADFKQRRANYESVYETVDDDDGSHVKIINSKRFIIHNIRGYLPLKVVHYVMNLHTLPRTFYLTRHGQSEYNLLGKIGGDSGLTIAGNQYAKRLAIFAKEHIAKEQEINDPTDSTGVRKIKKPTPARLWTSTLRRTKETAQYIQHETLEHTWDNGDTGQWVQFRLMSRRNLDELYAGICDGMTYKEIEHVYPEEFHRRQQDKLSYRYPRGESYMDVTLRLEPLAQEMERVREPVLIIGHQGILRILYAYFMGLDRKEAPYVNIPLNHVIELKPHAYGCYERRFCLMKREEMLVDGQDEPVTSMPRTTTTTTTPRPVTTPSTTYATARQDDDDDDDDTNAADPLTMDSSSSRRRRENKNDDATAIIGTAALTALSAGENDTTTTGSDDNNNNNNNHHDDDGQVDISNHSHHSNNNTCNGNESNDRNNDTDKDDNNANKKNAINNNNNNVKTTTASKQQEVEHDPDETETTSIVDPNDTVMNAPSC